MSEVRSIGSEVQVREAIARAASSRGVDFDYLLAQAKIESNLNPQAHAATSSAAGLYQFTNATWMQMLARHGGEIGLPWASDPAMRSQAMALRMDPDVSAQMAASLAADNRDALTGALGHAPDASELYLAHFLGPQGALRLLNGAAVDPAQPAASLLPAAAGANRAIFYRPDGTPRSIGEVMGLVRGKMDAAMGAGAEPLVEGSSSDLAAALPPPSEFPRIAPATGTSALPHQGPIAQEFAEAQAQAVPRQHSMAEVLQQTFAIGTPAASTLPDTVRTAYARLAALGL